MTGKEFEDLLDQLNTQELSTVHADLYTKFSDAPQWDSEATKPKNIRNFTYWVRGRPGRLNATIELVQKKLRKRSQYPIKIPAPRETEQKAISLWRTSPYEVELFFAQMMVRKYNQWHVRRDIDKLSRHKYHYELSLKKIREHARRQKESGQ